MAFDLSSTRKEVRIVDRTSSVAAILYAGLPTPREELAYQREQVGQRSGKMVNHVRQTRLKWGALKAEDLQAAATPDDEGYGYRDGHGTWVPLTTSVQDVPVDGDMVTSRYAGVYGAQWAGWIAKLPPWKLFILDRAPSHFEQVGMVVFESVAVGAATVRDEDDDDQDQEPDPGN